MLNNQTNNNKLVVPQSENVLDQMKYEIADELGIEIHADMTSRDAGKIGGSMVSKMIKMAQEQMDQQNNVH